MNNESRSSPLKQTMFGLFTSCMSMALLLAHYRAKGHYLRRVLALHPVSSIVPDSMIKSFDIEFE